MSHKLNCILEYTVKFLNTIPACSSLANTGKPPEKFDDRIVCENQTMEINSKTLILLNLGQP